MESPYFSISLDTSWQWTISVETWLLVAAIAAVCTLYVVISWLSGDGRFFAGGLEIDEAELGIGNQKIKLKRDHTDLQIAYKLWIELSTRKIGLEIDLENDVIVEIYDSWYVFFAVARELTKEIPVTKLKRDHTRAIVELAIKVLNAGVRPHLTRWQARFRRWYDHEAKNKPELSLQEIQQNYPHYDELVADMMKVNRQLISYKDKLGELVMGTHARPS